MDLLPLDIQIKLLMELSYEDILRLCRVSKNMSNFCSSNRYNRLWKYKIATDFKVEYHGDNAYNEYVKLTELKKYNQLLILVNKFKDLKQGEVLQFKNGQTISRDDARQLVKQWKASLKVLPPDEVDNLVKMIENILYIK